jgi:hypothetical protein
LFKPGYQKVRWSAARFFKGARAQLVEIDLIAFRAGARYAAWNLDPALPFSAGLD